MIFSCIFAKTLCVVVCFFFFSCKMKVEGEVIKICVFLKPHAVFNRLSAVHLHATLRD